MKKLIHDINHGVNLKKNLPLYGAEFTDVYLHYAALELTFSAFSLFDFMSGEITNDEWVSADEKKRYGDVSELLRRMLEEEKKPFSEAAYDTVAQRAQEIREEITSVMEVYTSYADHLVCYDKILDWTKFCYKSEEQLQQEINEVNEEEFLDDLMRFIFGTKDAGIRKERLRSVLREIPVQMTKGKLFEKIHQAFTLYQDGDRESLDRYVYILRSVAMLERPDESFVSDDWFRNFEEQLKSTDYAQIDETSFAHLSGQMEEATKRLRQVTDFYYLLEEMVNKIYALCLIRRHKETTTDLYTDCMDILQEVLENRFSEERLEQLEGKIEDYVERAGYLEAVLPEVRRGERELLEEIGLTADYDDYAAVVKLMSDSLFIPIEDQDNEQIVDKAVIDEVCDQLTAELSDLFRTLPRELRQAVMTMILGELPVMFKDIDECVEYFCTNLFGCQNLAKKQAALEELSQMMMEDELWNLEWSGEDDFLV